MARIEISMEEYNSLKDKIKTLEQEKADTAKQIAALKGKNSDLRDTLNEICASSLTERIFAWRKIVGPFKP